MTVNVVAVEREREREREREVFSTNVEKYNNISESTGNKPKTNVGLFPVLYLFEKKSGGITLIALVVTIIVLIIIAGVSMTMLTGENRNNNKSNRGIIQNRNGRNRRKNTNKKDGKSASKPNNIGYIYRTSKNRRRKKMESRIKI